MTQGINRRIGQISPRLQTTRSKAGFLTGMLRFMGFQKVRYQSPRSHFAEQRNRYRHEGKRMEQRQIAKASSKSYVHGGIETETADLDLPEPLVEMQLSEQEEFSGLCERFQAFWATGKNIQMLYQDMLDSGLGQVSSEAEEDRQLRLKLSLMLCGIAQIAGKGPHLQNRRLIRPISRARLGQLGGFLKMPLNQLVRTAYGNNHIKEVVLTRRLGNHPAILGGRTGMEPVKTVRQLQERYRLCREYLVSGEGNQVLEKSGFTALTRLSEQLPPRLATGVSDLELTMADKQLRLSNDKSATPVFGLKIPGIDFIAGCREVQYDSAIPEHRCLAIILELQTLSNGINEAKAMPGTKAMEPEDAMQQLEQIRVLNRFFLGMSHAVMKKKFSENFSAGRYQQLVLTGDGKRAVRWNSDYSQPRSGWLEQDQFLIDQDDNLIEF